MHGGSVRSRESRHRHRKHVQRANPARKPVDPSKPGTRARARRRRVGPPRTACACSWSTTTSTARACCRCSWACTTTRRRLPTTDWMPLKALEEFRPHVAFVDIGLPGLNGYEVARRVRAREKGRDEPCVILVALTGWGSDDDKASAQEAGFDFHLTKPVDAQEVEGLLNGLFRTGPAGRESVSRISRVHKWVIK